MAAVFKAMNIKLYPWHGPELTSYMYTMNAKNFQCILTV